MRTISLLLAAANLALAALAAGAARPRYGGLALVETGASIASLDPARLPADPAARSLADNLLFLVGDRLTRLDPRGALRPSLASAWQASDDGRVWSFVLREDASFSDGQPLRPADVVRSLAAAHPDWRLAVTAGQVRIALPAPMPDLPLELALPENTILRAGAGGLPVGTGPFHLSGFSLGRIDLAATENGWRPRPFLDGVEILTGRAPRDRWIDFELGRADLVELSPADVPQALAANAVVWSSKPMEVVALVFRSASAVAGDPRVRRALAASVNRAALCDVLLQKQGEAAESLLPDWLSGYGFLFASPAAAPAPAAPGSLPPVTLSFDSTDPLLASFAARIAVDAQAAGTPLHLAPRNDPGAAPPGDARLVRLPIASLDPASALDAMLAPLDLGGQLPLPMPADPQSLYQTESALLAAAWVVPLVDLPDFYAVGTHLRDWDPPPIPLAGGWRLENVWKEPG